MAFPKNVAAVPMVWYRPDTYEGVRAISDDPDNFHETFAEWRRQAQKLFDELRADGARVVKVQVEEHGLRAYALRHQRRIDAKTRAAYAGFILINRENRRH